MSYSDSDITPSIAKYNKGSIQVNFINNLRKSVIMSSEVDMGSRTKTPRVKFLFHFLKIFMVSQVHN